MLCPHCGKEMKAGKVQNTSTNHVMLLFKADGEEIRFKDLFKKEFTEAMIVGGSEMDAFFCEDCKKIVLITDCM